MGMSLVVRILIGLVIGVVLGLLCPQWTAIGILGKVFVSALKSIAPVLVAVLVAASIAKAKGDSESISAQSSRSIFSPPSWLHWWRWWGVFCSP